LKIALNISQNALKKSIEKNSGFLAAETLDKINRTIYMRYEEILACFTDRSIKKVLLSSNKVFDQMPDAEGYIIGEDKKWVSVEKDTITSFMKAIIDSELSASLRDLIVMLKKRYGYEVFGEIFVTNQYGVNIAQTGKTTDYYQGDEDWWAKAASEGLFIGDVEYDERGCL